MKALALVVFSLASVTCTAGGVDSWFNDWPSGATGQEIPPDRVIEIPHSLFENAQELLKEKSFIPIGSNYFPGFRYNCPSSTNAYLVRALYEHATTGTFLISRSGNDLLVRHYALGPQSQLHRSALVVCLDFVPAQAYVATGGAM
jgi:hypothetical protein